jgi:cytochrome d ubiquinol oxidase subunit I
VVALSGLLSAVFVTLVNAWMNSPTGFTDRLDPVAAMANPFALHEVLHGCLAAYMATALMVAAIHAWQLLKHGERSFHRKALNVALWVALPATLLQPLAGHHAGQVVAEREPMKLAAMEDLEHTQAHAPLHVGIEIPDGLSILAFNHGDAVVKGLDEVPPADRPSHIVRFAWLLMIALGSAAAAWAGVTAFALWRRRELLRARGWLWATLALGPSGVLALEAGWTVTELGRQPWVIYGIMRTADAVTPKTGLWVPFTTFAVIYLGLAVVVTVAVMNHVRASRAA